MSFRCETLHWHKPSAVEHTGYDNAASQCARCGRRILRDSTGSSGLR